MELTLRRIALQKSQHLAQDLLCAVPIGLDVESCVLARVAQATLLFRPVSFQPVEFAALDRDRIRRIQENQNIRVGDAFPHILYIRMFLCDMSCAIPAHFQPPDECGFSGSAYPHHTDQEPRTVVFRSVFTHFRASNDLIAVVRPAQPMYPRR